jgi:hypothetical protein
LRFSWPRKALRRACILVTQAVEESEMAEYHDRHTMERMREHLARADGELEAAQHFLDPGSAEGAEMDLIRAVAAARVAVGDALEAVRLRVGESDRG